MSVVHEAFIAYLFIFNLQMLKTLFKDPHVIYPLLHSVSHPPSATICHQVFNTIYFFYRFDN